MNIIQDEINKIKDENKSLRLKIYSDMLENGYEAIPSKYVIQLYQEIKENEIKINTYKMVKNLIDMQNKMNREDYEKYYKKGGFYEIPVEVLNNILDVKNDFIEWVENEISETNKTIERLEGTNSCRIPNLKIRLSNYQEVLDKFRGVIDE